MQSKISISRKFLFNSLIALFIASFYLIFLFLKEGSTENSQAVADLSTELSFVEKNFNDSTKYISLIIAGIADEINKDPQNEKHVANVLRKYRILHENKIKNILSISMFSWVDRNNKLAASSEIGVARSNIDMSSRDYLKMTKENPNKLYFGKPVIGIVSAKNIIPAGMGLFSKKGEYQGSIVMGFNVEGIYQRFLQNRVFAGSNLQIIYDDEVEVVKELSLNKEYLSKINKNDFDVQVIRRPSIFSSGQILIYKKIAETPYGLLISSHYLNDISVVNKTDLLELLIGILCFASLIYLLRKNFINPIIELSKKAELIAKGDKNTDIAESNIIEIDQLYKAIISIKKFIRNESELKDQLYATNIKLQSLSGAVGHEIRNSLAIIRAAQNQIRELAIKENGDNKNQLLELTYQISNSVIEANNIINIVLADLKENPIDTDFSYLEADEVISEIIKKFSYNSEAEKAKVKLDITPENNFIFKATKDRFALVINNLLKNALYYLKDYPSLTVTIGAEIEDKGQGGPVDFSKYNVIYVYDTGPGIPAHIITKLFDDFFTSGKKEGTGLGLAFCKSNMQIFHGDIIVQSEHGQDGKNGWTKFSLLFPKLSAEKIRESIIEGKKRKILIVDDGEINLVATKSKIENALSQVSCDIAKNGFEAIKMANENKYHLILMDVQMPEISGAETAKEIKKFNRDVPIIAYSSLDKESFLKEINNSLLESDFDYYLNKSVIYNILFRAIFKWIVGFEDDFSYLGKIDIKALNGKRVIIADDQKTMRAMTRVTLEKYGLQIVEAADGKELVEIYKKSLDKNGKSNFDIIVTDINMSPYNGDKAAKEIRQIEASHNISHHDEIPIIAVSGNVDVKNVHHFFEYQMTDYLIKGSDPELLLKMIANYLIKKSSDEFTYIKNDYDLENYSQSIEEFPIINNDNLDHFKKEDQDEILQLFLLGSYNIMNKIKESAKDGDIKELLFHIHTLKGNAANIGAARLCNYVRAIEPMLINVSLSDSWLTRLEIIYDEVVVEIRKIIGANLQNF